SGGAFWLPSGQKRNKFPNIFVATTIVFTHLRQAETDFTISITKVAITKIYPSRGEEYESCFDDRALSAWFDLPDVRAQRISALHSYAAAYGGCRAVHRRDFRIAVLCCGLPAADRARPASFGKSVRSAGVYTSGPRRFQHSLFPHFHGAC